MPPAIAWLACECRIQCVLAANAPEGHRHAECRLLQADGLQELDEGKDDGDGADLFRDGISPVFVDGTPRAARW